MNTAPPTACRIMSPANLPIVREHVAPYSASVTTQVALWILFVGTGIAVIVPFLASYWFLPVPRWIVDRFSLLVALPALLLSTRYFSYYGGFERSRSLLLFAVWMAISLLWGDSTELGRGLLAVVNFCITLPLASLVRTHRNPRQVVIWFGTAFVAAVTFVALSGASHSGRFGDFIVDGSPVMNSNQVGMLSVIVVVLMYGCVAERGHGPYRQRAGKQGNSVWLPSLIGIAACVYALLTASRTAGVSLAIAISLIALRHTSRFRLLAALCPLLVTVVIAAATATSIADGWIERFSAPDISSLNGRTDIWETLWAVLKGPDVHFLGGVGCGGSDKRLGEELGVGVVHPKDGILRMHSHNLYLEWFAELGVIGIALALTVVIHAVTIARQNDHQHKSVYRVTFLLVLAVYGMTGVPTRHPAFAGLASLLWASLSPLPKRLRSE